MFVYGLKPQISDQIHWKPLISKTLIFSLYVPNGYIYSFKACISVLKLTELKIGVTIELISLLFKGIGLREKRCLTVKRSGSLNPRYSEEIGLRTSVQAALHKELS